MNKIAKKLLVLGAVALSGTAAAQSNCSYFVSNYNLYLSSYGPTDPLTIYYYNDAVAHGCFGASGGAVGQAQLQGTSVQQAFTVFNAITSRPSAPSSGPSPLTTGQANGITGLSGGNEGSKWNAWVSGSSNTQRYSGNGTLGTHSTTDIMNGVAGADYQIMPSLVLGASVALDNGDTRLAVGGPTLITTGHTIAPYLSWQINNAWSLDGTLGYGNGEARAGANYTKSTRNFSGLNLAYTQWHGDWQYSGKASLVHAKENMEDTTAAGVTVPGTGNKNKLTQVRLGAQVAYWANGVMPYVGLAFSQDTSRTEVINNPWDKSAMVFTAGVNFISIKDNVTGGIVYTNEFARRDVANYSWMANINLRF